MAQRKEPSHGVGEYVRGYEAEQRLRGFRCSACGFTTATWGLACSRCGAAGLIDADLPLTGSIVAYTLIEVPTEEMINDAPYAYVLVELDGGARISGWMPSVRRTEEIAVGERVRFRPGYRPGVQFERANAVPGA